MTLSEIISQIESCGYTCEAGNLERNRAWIELKALSEPNNQKLWRMAKVITERQKAAKEKDTGNVDWLAIEETWFDWLEEMSFI